jgi:hypothetical protein
VIPSYRGFPHQILLQLIQKRKPYSTLLPTKPFQRSIRNFHQRYSNPGEKNKPIDAGETFSLFFFLFFFLVVYLSSSFLAWRLSWFPLVLRMCHSSKASSFVAIFLGSSCGSLLLFSFMCVKWEHRVRILHETGLIDLIGQRLGYLKPKPWPISIPTWALISGQIL